MAPKPQRRDVLTAEYQKLVEQYIPMAKYEARKMARSMRDFFDYETLEAEALFGLVDAISRYPSYCDENGYDPKNLDYIQHFVTQRTRGHLFDFIRHENHLTRTEYDRAKEIKIKLAEGKKTEQIALELDCTTGDVRKTMANVREHPMSLNAGKNDFGVASVRRSSGLKKKNSFASGEELNHNWDAGAEVATLEDIVSIKQLNNDDLILAQVMMTKLTAAFVSLNEVQKTVLTLRYFCNVGVRDVADMMEISSVLVNKIQAEALEAIVDSVSSEL